MIESGPMRARDKGARAGPKRVTTNMRKKWGALGNGDAEVPSRAGASVWANRGITSGGEGGIRTLETPYEV